MGSGVGALAMTTRPAEDVRGRWLFGASSRVCCVDVCCVFCDEMRVDVCVSILMVSWMTAVLLWGGSSLGRVPSWGGFGVERGAGSGGGGAAEIVGWPSAACDRA